MRQRKQNTSKSASPLSQRGMSELGRGVGGEGKAWRLLTLIFLSLCLVGCGKKAEEAKEAEVEHEAVAVEVAVASVLPMESTVSAQGTLSAAQGASTRVGAVMAGRLVSVNVREGQAVKQGRSVGNHRQPRRTGAVAQCVCRAECLRSVGETKSTRSSRPRSGSGEQCADWLS